MTRHRSPTAEERRLWRLAMRDADPLPGRVADLPEPPPAAEAEPVATSLAPPPVPMPPRDARPVGRPSLPPLTPGSITDMDRRTGDRFRKGQLVIDARIDLHGMTQAQAHGALAGFVHHAWAQGRRCVLVITGKGTWSGGAGVLRAAVPRWLADSALRPMILAIHPAQPKDGGDGALYVLLKRHRDRK